MEFTKESLMAMGIAEELANKIVAAYAEAQKKFIPKSRFDEVIAEREEAKRLLTESNAKIEELSKVDPKELEAQITQLKGDLAQSQKDSDEKLAAAKRDSAVRLALTGQVHDADLVISQLDTSKITIKDDGSVDGLDGQIKDLREKKSFLFVPEGDIKIPGVKLIGKTPPDGSRPAGNGSESGSLGSRLAKMKVAQNKTVERSEEHYFKKG
jgi:hypothetical protein